MVKMTTVMAKARQGEKLNKKELRTLYSGIMDQMFYLRRHNMQDTKEGKTWQKQMIISIIDAYPELLHIQAKIKNNQTIGIRAACYELFYVTMRALEDAEACLLKDDDNNTIFDKLKGRDAFCERVINSQEYERLIEKLEARLAGKEEPKYDDVYGVVNDRYDDLSEYDSIIDEDDEELFNGDECFDEDENTDEYDSIVE